MGALGIGPGVRVVAYDDASGGVAARLWYVLRAYGHDEVAVLDGGLARWQAEGRPVSSEAPAIAPVAFAARLRPGRLVNKAELVASHRARLVLDARAPERYRGETEPVDPRAGHIPGARNAPWTRNLTAEPVPVFLPPSVLRRHYEALGAAREKPVVYCGSGVNACHDILALQLAGLDGSLYAGSWSEWSSDPSLPAATGDAAWLGAERGQVRRQPRLARRPRLRRAGGLVLSREVVVLTNAIAFNALLCLFPLLLVLIAAAQQLAPGRRHGDRRGPAARRADPVRRRDDGRLAAADDAARARPRAAVAGARRLGLLGDLHPGGDGPEPRVGRDRDAQLLEEPTAGVRCSRSRPAAWRSSRSGSRCSRAASDADWPLLTRLVVKAAAVLLTWALFAIVYRLASSARVRPAPGAAGRALGGGPLGGLEVRVRLEPRPDAARDALRPARLRRVARALGLRLEPGARVRRGDERRRRAAGPRPPGPPSGRAGRAAGGGRA